MNALQAQSEHNITHIDVPRGGSDRYRKAADLLSDWRRTGVLVADEGPSYTLYRMRFTDASGTARDIAGVIGGLEITDEGAGGVLPHERTTPKASTDRLDLTRATRANLSPVWGLSLASGLTSLLTEPGSLGMSPRRSRACGGRCRSERIAGSARAGRLHVLIATATRYSLSRTYLDDSARPL